MILAVQKVQVINWPSPVPTPTPDQMLPIALPHVDVSWLTLWITVVGVLVAAAALLIAIVAANYAKKAWQTAESDLRISKDNWETSQRSPDLVAWFTMDAPYEQHVGIDGAGRHVTYSYPVLKAFVMNTDKGKRRCDAFYIEVIVPIEALSKPEQARLNTQVAHYGTKSESRVHNVVPIFPGSRPVEVSFLFPLDYPSIARELTLQYRLKDDYHDYPPEGYMVAKVSYPSRPQSVFVNPRDDAENKLYSIIFEAGIDEAAKYRKYVNAFELLELAPGPQTPQNRIKTAEELAHRILSTTE